MDGCFLNGHGTCGGKTSREHYISETVLRAIDGGDGYIQIGGFPWQPKQVLQTFGIQSLVSRVLCEAHNSRLSSLDSEAGTLFRAIDAADKRPSTSPALTTVDGSLIQRWFLKVVCGLVAGVGFSTGAAPDEWCSILCGEPWPAGWGLYVLTVPGPKVLARELAIETIVNHESMSIMAVKFRVAGVHFSLLLGRPDNPPAWGIYRPRGCFRHNGIA